MDLIEPAAIKAVAARTPATNTLNTVLSNNLQYLFTQSFENTLGFDVVVIDINNNRTLIRSGVPFNLAKPMFKISRHYKWNTRAVVFDMPATSSDPSGKIQLKGISEDSTDFNDVLANLIFAEESLKINKNSGAMFGTVTVNVTESLLKQYDGAIFIRELGVVIATPGVARRTLNPLSPEYRLSHSTNDTQGFVYRIFANDPTGVEYDTRYVNINESVYKVPVYSDPAMVAGVYVSRGLPPHGEEHTDADLLLDHYDFEEADEKLNLFDNPNDAKNYMGLEGKRQENKLKQLEHDLKVHTHQSKMEMDQAQVEFTKIKNQMELDHKREINKIETEYKTKITQLKSQIEDLKAKADARASVLKEKADHYDEVSMARKDSYESSSYARKTSSDILKWIPAVVGGIAACAAFAFALFL